MTAISSKLVALNGGVAFPGSDGEHALFEGCQLQKEI